MIYKAKYIKCIVCNTFYERDRFLKKDIEDMKHDKLIKCADCKYYPLFSLPRRFTVTTNV